VFGKQAGIDLPGHDTFAGVIQVHRHEAPPLARPAPMSRDRGSIQWSTPMSENDADLEARVLARDWFYEIELPSGRVTSCYLPEPVRPLHTTRRRMLLDALRARFGPEWAALSVLDVACHEGYFALELARRGCGRVVGLDVREEHVAHADLVRRTHRLDTLSFVRGDVLAIDPATFGRFDVVLAFGLLYHLPDVVGAMAVLRALTARVCLVETQVCPELPPSLAWGSRDWQKPIEGACALVDEATEIDAGNREASRGRVSLVPSPRALRFLAGVAGFRQYEALVPPPGAHEQLASGARLMAIAEA
jgi:SAM-dependent methyltransferase